MPVHAGKNIDEAIEETRTEHRRLRQELITAEILDVVTGYEASSGSPGGDTSIALLEDRWPYTHGNKTAWGSFQQPVIDWRSLS